MKNLMFMMTVFCAPLCAATQASIAIDRIDQVRVEENRYYAEDVIRAHKNRFTGAAIAAGGVTTGLVGYNVWKKYNEKGLHECFWEHTQQLAKLEERVKNLEQPRPSAPPADEPQQTSPFLKSLKLRCGKVFKKMHTGAGNVLSAAGWLVGWVILIGGGLEVAGRIVATIVSLGEISITSFMKEHTHFNAHVLAGLEGLEDYGARYATVTDDQKVDLFLHIEHAVNCIMRDLERIMGYIEAVVYRVPDYQLSDYQAQEKQLLQDYVRAFYRSGNHIADLIEQLNDADYDKIVTIAHAFRNESQRLYNDCHALATIESSLNH